MVATIAGYRLEALVGRAAAPAPCGWRAGDGPVDHVVAVKRVAAADPDAGSTGWTARPRSSPRSTIPTSSTCST